jgi:hypothetical protein
VASDRHALLIGSYEYANEPALHGLRGPANDIEALDAVLSDAAIGDFATQTSINESSATVLERLEGFLKDRARDDVALLYFSGHGIKDVDGELYFAMANTRLNRLRATALKARDVHDLLRSSKARQQLLLLDCCYSGAFAKGLVVRGDNAANTVDYFDGRGHAVLTASDSIQYAFEDGHAQETASGAPQSVFTRVLVEGLTSGDADTDRDGVVTIDELYDYVHAQVRRRNPNQTPRKWALDQQGKVVVAKVMGKRVKAARLREDLQDALADPRPYVRLSAVDQLKQLLTGKHVGVAMAAREALERLVEMDDSRAVSNAARLALDQHQAPGREPEGVSAVQAESDRALPRQDPRPAPAPVVAVPAAVQVEAAPAIAESPAVTLKRLFTVWEGSIDWRHVALLIGTSWLVGIVARLGGNIQYIGQALSGLFMPAAMTLLWRSVFVVSIAASFRFIRPTAGAVLAGTAAYAFAVVLLCATLMRVPINLQLLLSAFTSATLQLGSIFLAVRFLRPTWISLVVAVTVADVLSHLVATTLPLAAAFAWIQYPNGIVANIAGGVGTGFALWLSERLISKRRTRLQQQPALQAARA